MVLKFVPPTYIKYLNQNMDTKIIVSVTEYPILTPKQKVPHKNLAGNKTFEENFSKNYRLVNAWREGNDQEIVYEPNPSEEESFFTINPTNEYSTVTLIGKERDE